VVTAALIAEFNHTGVAAMIETRRG